MKITPYEKNRKEIVHLLNEICPNGIGIEIGVKQATFSHVLLSGWNNSKLYLVDPWEDQDKSVYDEDIHNHESDYNIAIQKLTDFEDRYEVVRKYSNDAHSNFANHSVDFIYVDGNHSYEGVKSDLELFYPKLKYGGVMMGDDYHVHELEKVFGFDFGVTKAVNEFAINHRHNLSLQYFGDWHYNNNEGEMTPSRNWMFIK